MRETGMIIIIMGQECINGEMGEYMKDNGLMTLKRVKVL